MKRTLAIIFLCLALFGCMKQSGGKPANSRRSVATGSATCLVYCAKDWSRTCQFLADDLEWLSTKHGWTVSTDPRQSADFVLVPRRDESQVVPYLEFYSDSQLVNTHLGYSDSPDRNVRLRALQHIVSKHPKRRR